ncbi:hypothetical protein GDO78_002754 [Eleutherodactylus coqui]|uniref:Uncharacterized protein n=1 Tax=Eleutherodactylus coqui TaxID=57060 RepID=A0A8J6EYU5_ELECQ|nr:hypothetical protein GDO78_002754 [Eleutherodactylus coqui]
MNDMRAFMLTPDEKLERHLNRRFQHVDSWMPPQETHATSQPFSSRRYQQTENFNGTRPQPPQRRIATSSEEATDEPWTLVTPVPQLRCHCYRPRRKKPIQTEQDIQETESNIEELLYQMEVLGEKTRWDLDWKLDYYLPGYRGRSATRYIPADPQLPRSMKKKVCKDDVFKRLSAPRQRTPSPCHAISCDAFKLGIADKMQRKGVKCCTATLQGSWKSQTYKHLPTTMSAKM